MLRTVWAQGTKKGPERALELPLAGLRVNTQHHAMGGDLRRMLA